MTRLRLQTVVVLMTLLASSMASRIFFPDRRTFLPSSPLHPPVFEGQDVAEPRLQDDDFQDGDWAEQQDSMVMSSAESNAANRDSYGMEWPWRPRNTLNDPNCGVTKFDGDRIVGGQEAKVGQYPWSVAMIMGMWGTQFCGGSLINEKYVLTAAHCVAWGKGALKMTLRIGDHDLKKVGEAASLERGVKALKIHISYNTSNTDFDVALVELDAPVPLKSGGTAGNSNVAVASVCLPINSNEDYVGRNATVTGWGMTSYNGRTSDHLRQVNVTVISNDRCRRMYSSSMVTQNMLCAGDANGGHDACQGDSGGPLVLKNRQKWEQIGIVSWGKECALAAFPGVYTRVTKFYDWIKRHSHY